VLIYSKNYDFEKKNVFRERLLSIVCTTHVKEELRYLKNYEKRKYCQRRKKDKKVVIIFTFSKKTKNQQGVNFTNILRAAFSFESVLRSFSPLTFWLCNFCRKNINKKTARKINDGEIGLRKKGTERAKNLQSLVLLSYSL